MPTRYFIWILIAFVLLNHVCWAREAGAAAASPTTAVASLTNAAAMSGEDVPVIVPAPSEKAVRLYRTGNVWWGVKMAWGLALPALFLFCGFSARLRDVARRIGRRWYFIIVCYFIVLALIGYAVNWPLEYYLGFVRLHAYGLSNQSFAKWIGDSLKGLGILIVVGSLVLWVPYWLLRKSPRRWWLYVGLAMIPFYFFVQSIRPVVIEPMFNEFTPIKNKELEAKILALAERSGIHGSRVYEVKKSVDTKTANAYVTGFWRTKRIVLWDTILNKLDDRQLLFVMGHEMGHYALGHVVKGILFVSVLTFAALYGIHRTAYFLINRCRERFGFSELSDIASLPLMVLLINLFSLLLIPVGFAYSRHLEHEADRFGLELTHYNHSAATGFVRLQQENLGMPRPGMFYKTWRATHPSIGDRIDFFNNYKPWNRGEPSKYERYFQPEGHGDSK